MTKQDFIKTMKELKRITDELGRLRDLKRTTFLEKDFCGSYDLGITELETLVVDTLKRAMDDKDDWIAYYIYELDWGKTSVKYPVEIGGKKYKLKTLNDLYTLLDLLKGLCLANW